MSKNILSKSFKNTDLENFDFREARAGHSNKFKALIFIVFLIVIPVLSMTPVYAGGLLEGFISYSLEKGYGFLFVLFFISAYITSLIVLPIKGLHIFVVGGFVSLFLVSAIISTSFSTSYSPASSILILSVTTVMSWVGSIAIGIFYYAANILFGRVGKTLFLSSCGLVSFLFIEKLIDTVDVSQEKKYLIRAVVTASATLIYLIGSLVERKAQKGAPEFNWMTRLVVFWSAIGGTSFYGANLTDVCFEGADLRYADLRKTNLIRTNFKGVTGLELARLQGTILEQPNVRKLLTSGDGYDKDFTEADLSNLDLRDIDLREASLVKAQLLNTDLSGACLTDACIQDWNINHNTRFNNVDCKRVYLRQSPSGHFLEPKPDSGEFGPGEFEKWITDVRDTIDLIFQNGLNWRAFAFSLTQTAINNEGIDLSVRSIENKGDGVVVAKVGVSLDTNKTSIHQEITEHYNGAVAAIEAKYELVLKAKDDEIDRLVSFHETQQRFIQGLVAGIAEPKERVLIQGEGNRVYVMNQAGDVMENSNQNINAGGNVDASTGTKVTIGGDVTGSSINLGEISGQVSNTIQQLQDIKTADGNDLAKILTLLQKSINEDQALSDAQKKQALEAVETLADEGKKPPESRATKFCSMAVNALKGLAGTVADASKLAEVLKTSLPTLTKLLGL